MRHLTRLEQLEYRIEFLKEQRRLIDEFIKLTENELEEEKEKVKKKEVQK